MSAIPFDLHALHAFVAVCEGGSMIEAARKLGVTQSAVSQLIKSLETQSGMLLLDREFRPSRPTAAGRLLLELAQDLLEHAQRVNERLLDASKSEIAQFRLGGVDSFSATVGPAIVRALSKNAREISLWSGLTPTLSEQLQRRELDLAVCTESTVNDSRIEQRLLFSEAFVAVVPRSMAVADGDYRKVFESLPLMRYTKRSVIGQQIERYLRHIGLDAARRFEFDATDPLLNLVAWGIGYAVTTPLCLWQSRHCLDDVTVVPLPASQLGRRNFFLLSREGEWTGLADEISVITRQVLEQQISPAIQAVLPTLPKDAFSWK
ncbi:LysR family transcriptional regulator [Herbaspirillum sp. RV1423]|uniref:LysR family transcriptional regulator n=1 Tax=Herbaspirillum sp. RV1423 TaxID=1443993 RepID=UPI0005504B15|nr:LysR family transcriptional regulator [Herbaspirillum sp. RV1423]